MIRVGLTGGIGSGKSTVCKIFSVLGIPVFHADDESKELLAHDQGIRDGLVRLLGRDIYKDNKPDRSRIASMIFNNKYLIQEVNRIVHPKVVENFTKWCEQFKSLSYIIHESALIFEGNFSGIFDKIITVYAPEEIRIQRVLARNEMNIAKIKAIMENQLDDQYKIQRSDVVIINDETKLILPQIITIHKKLINN